MLSNRAAHQDDVRNLTVMLNASGGMQFFKAIFGTFHLPNMLDTSFMSLVAEASGLDNGPAALNPLKGFMCLSDAIPILTGENCFENALAILGCHVPVNVHNTLFINFWMMDEKAGASRGLVLEAFALMPNLDYLFWVCPVNFTADDFVQSAFSVMGFDKEYMDGLTPKGVFGSNKVLFIHRSALLPRLQVRTARVEDNDDLIPIIQQANPSMLDGQNSYFLAELIDAQDASNSIAVGLHGRDIQGMLATSLDVNMSLIMKIFDIDAYPDLVIKADQLPPPAPLVIAVVGDLRILNAQAVEIATAHQNCLFVNAEKMLLPGEESKEEHLSLQGYISSAIANHGDPALQAVVLWGFPRSEAETSLYKHAILNEFDVILELNNVSEEAEEDDEDDFLQSHLDGLEALREICFNNNNSFEPFSRKVTWKKVTYEKDNYQTNRPEDLQKFMTSLSGCLEDRKQRVEATRAINNEKPPKANGFAITALCLYEEFHSRAIDLVKYAFERQPSLDYCLYMVPCQEGSSMLTHCFNYVSTRAGVSFDQSLYIIHRAYFYALEFIEVQRLSVKVLQDAYSFLQPVKQIPRQDIIDSMQRGIEENDVDLADNPAEVTFTILLNRRIVGLIVLSRRMLSSDDVTWYRGHYHLDETVSLSRHRLKAQYMMTHFLIDTVFSSLNRLLLSDVMRLCRKTVFYHHCDKLDAPPKEVLESFVLLRPRRKPQGALGDTVKRPKHSNLHLLGPDSPLFCIVKHHLSHRKDIVAKRVVIAGGSSHSFAFLETICSVQDVYFPNVYMVLSIPPPPMKDDSESSEESKHDEEYSGCLSLQDVDFPTTEELWCMGYRHRINILRGHLTDIDRENRAVVLSDELVLEYDYLLISTYSQDNSCRRIPSLSGVHPAKCADAGIFALGNPAADLLALSYVKKRAVNRAESVVICGQGVKVLAAAEGLIRSGIEPSKIACVIEEPGYALEGCGEVGLSKLVAQSAQVAGITDVYFRAGVSEVSLSRTGFLQSVDLHEIQGTTIVSKHEKDRIPPPAGIPCTALLVASGAEYQSCERDVFAAINDCGLVFDGGLVVDLSFRTVDPCIYAVADFTKFSRVYRDDLPHHKFNPRELGIFVALQMIMQHLHPSPDRLRSVHKSVLSAHMVDVEHSSVSKNAPKSQFSLPRSMTGPLPGDLTYFYSALPRLPRDLIGYITDNSQSTVQRFGPPPPRRITLLKTDSYGTVSELVYAGLDLIEPRNLCLLPGKHEAFLNSAVHAHNKKYVEDWIDFFRGAWASVIYQDNFPALMAALKKNMQSDKGMIMLLSRIFEKAELEQDNVAVGEYRTVLVGAHGEMAPEITKKIIEVETLEFLRENKDFLPRLYVPSAH